MPCEDLIFPRCDWSRRRNTVALRWSAAVCDGTSRSGPTKPKPPCFAHVSKTCALRLVPLCGTPSFAKGYGGAGSRAN